MDTDFIIRLITRYQDGTATPGERYLLERWYDSFDNEPEKALPIDNPDYPSHLHREILGRIPQEKTLPRRRFRWVRLAASIVLAVATAWTLHRLYNTAPKHDAKTYVEFATQSGQTKKLLLQDSTIVILHANSSLRVPSDYGNSKREVTLSGEAFFEVTADASLPFQVQASPIVIAVLGTSFNVNAYKDLDYVQVEVETGEVRVLKGEKTLGLLDGGSRLIFGRHGESSTIQKGVSSKPEWLEGRVRLVDATFAELKHVFHNVYGTRIDSEDPAVVNGRFNMTVSRSRSIGLAMEQLCTLIGKNYRKEANGIYYIE